LGRKHIGTGKHVFLCFASLIFLFFSGCATVKDFEKKYDAHRVIHQGQKFFARGEFKRSAEEYQKAVSIIGKDEPGDQALMNLGIIYAHPDNPGRDYEKSRHYFTLLMEEFPVSSLVDKARIWVSLYDVIDRSEKETRAKDEIIQKLNNRLSAFNHLLAGQDLLDHGDYSKALKEYQKSLETDQTSPAGDQALFNMGLIYANYENPDKDFQKSSGYFKRLVEEYPRSPLRGQAEIWLGVLDIIEKSKQVDIEIEKKKKELAR
jgi:outer membrane protein assembly factor BamD (BamD/ComL family)